MTTTDEKATILNRHFAAQTKLQTTPELPSPKPRLTPVPTSSLISVTEHEVLTVLNSLELHKSTGPDEIPKNILKMIAILIVNPLAKLYNKSSEPSKFPDMLKEAIISSIFKRKGSALDPQSYRPINFLCCPTKIIEKQVLRHIYNHLIDNSLLSDLQGGYRPRHST